MEEFSCKWCNRIFETSIGSDRHYRASENCQSLASEAGFAVVDAPPPQAGADHDIVDTTVDDDFPLSEIEETETSSHGFTSAAPLEQEGGTPDDDYLDNDEVVDTDGNNLGPCTEPPTTLPQWYDQVEGARHLEAPLRYIPFFDGDDDIENDEYLTLVRTSMSCSKYKKQGEPMLPDGWTVKMKKAAQKKAKDSLSKQRNHLRATYLGKFSTLSYLFHIDIAQWCMY
jgi:hypothetical protein